MPSPPFPRRAAKVLSTGDAATALGRAHGPIQHFCALLPFIYISAKCRLDVSLFLKKRKSLGLFSQHAPRLFEHVTYINKVPLTLSSIALVKSIDDDY